MEIIKEGKVLPITDYFFICGNCGCEFVANEGETNDNLCKCPNCFKWCYGSVINDDNKEN